MTKAACAMRALRTVRKNQTAAAEQSAEPEQVSGANGQTPAAGAEGEAGEVSVCHVSTCSPLFFSSCLFFFPTSARSIFALLAFVFGLNQKRNYRRACS